MKQKAARVSADEIFQQMIIPFEQIPHQSTIFRDFLKNSADLEEFYPEKNTAPEQFAAKVLENYQTDRRVLCDALTRINKNVGSGSGTFENIEQLRESDCLTIVTGQQAGLFSGALYTIYKALSAVKLAAELRKRRIKAVPVFWIAEEDHDFDEIKKTFVLDKKGNLGVSENSPAERIENSPVGLTKLDETIGEAVKDLFEQLPHTEFTEEIKKILTESYEPSETYSIAFAKFIAKIFDGYGLIILTPLDAELKELCAPIFTKAVEHSDELISKLLERDEVLKEKNYQPQVLVEKNSFPFFFQNDKGERQALRTNQDSGKIKVNQSKTEFTKSELAEIAANSPQSLSPNALLRPVVQDYLLPTLMYFGGAAEIAYFAQNSVIYKVLDRPATPINHRASLTVIEPKHRRTLNKYGLKFTDLFDGKEAVYKRVVERFLNERTAQTFSEVEDNIKVQLKNLSDDLAENDPTLAANLANREKKILWHLAALRKKYHRAEMLKNEVAANRLETLFTALLPHAALQERTLNVNTFLNLYGTNFIGWIYEAVKSGEQEHTVLYL